MRAVPGLRILRRIATSIHRRLAACSFITLHHAYFIVTCLVVSGIFYGASRPLGSVSYVDCLYLVVSAMTETGLNTVNLSQLNTAQQVMLFLLLIFGSAIFVSSFVVHVRKRAFERKFDHIAHLRQTQRRRRSASGGRPWSRSRSRSRSRAVIPRKDVVENDREEEAVKMTTGDGQRVEPGENPASLGGMDTEQITHEDELHVDRERGIISTGNPPAATKDGLESLSPSRTPMLLGPTQDLEIEIEPAMHISFSPNLAHPRSGYFLPTHGVGARSDASTRRLSLGQVSATNEHQDGSQKPSKHLPFDSAGHVSRNSQFHHLSEKERRQLGGYEYRAVRLLAWLVPTYFVLFQLLSCLALGAYVANNKASVALENGLNPWWVGSFNAVSAFNNSGMSLLDANMIAFQTSIYMLLTMSLLILAGNTCYPIFLRLIVWTFLKLLPNNERWADNRKTLKFLLDHPRRCYTNMFPSRHTWWLLLAVIVLNGIDWMGFELLNIGNHAITSLPNGIRVLDGLFQAFAVRSGGFYVVNISTVRISLQVLYVIMMYISVYPVVITMRNSNVYEERSLGIYADDPGYASQAQKGGGKGKRNFFWRTLTNTPFEETTQYFVRQQLRAQLSHDLWWLVLAVFIIMCIEASSFEENPAVFSVFNVIFETVSAYGCVGISVGLPNEAYSFSGSWKAGSKLVLCAVMLRGRHRGLPVAIDKAVLLPREELGWVEEDDAVIRMERTVSRGRVA